MPHCSRCTSYLEFGRCLAAPRPATALALLLLPWRCCPRCYCGTQPLLLLLPPPTGPHPSIAVAAALDDIIFCVILP